MHSSLLITMAIELKRYWFAEPVYDFELKQYEFLAYMKDFRKAIDLKQIHPWLRRLDQLKNDMLSFMEQKKKSNALRRLSLKGIDFQNTRLTYEWQQDIQELSEVTELINYAKPILDTSIVDIRNLREEIVNSLRCDHLGLYTSYPGSGFILLNHLSGIYAYAYNKQIIHYENRVSMSHLDVYGQGAYLRIEQIRRDLITSYPDQSSTTWYITGGEALPVEETLKPLVSEIIYSLV